jgi:hypothetical protein
MVHTYVNDMLDIEDIYEEIDINEDNKYNQIFSRQVFQIDYINNKKKTRLVIFLIGLFILCSTLFSGFYIIYFNDSVFYFNKNSSTINNTLLL